MHTHTRSLQGPVGRDVCGTSPLLSPTGDSLEPHFLPTALGPAGESTGNRPIPSRGGQGQQRWSFLRFAGADDLPWSRGSCSCLSEHKAQTQSFLSILLNHSQSSTAILLFLNSRNSIFFQSYWRTTDQVCFSQRSKSDLTP